MRSQIQALAEIRLNESSRMSITSNTEMVYTRVVRGLLYTTVHCKAVTPGIASSMQQNFIPLPEHLWVKGVDK